MVAVSKPASSAIRASSNVSRNGSGAARSKRRGSDSENFTPRNLPPPGRDPTPRVGDGRRYDAAMSDYETLLVTEDDGILWVSLNRPEVRNAISAQMQADLRSVWTAARWDDDVKCIVLTAEGNHFCTGID